MNIDSVKQTFRRDYVTERFSINKYMADLNLRSTSVTSFNSLISRKGCPVSKFRDLRVKLPLIISMKAIIY